ncbi:hypothetical protein GCM10009802_32650 [Streptomyces synnematoformans]|uniref:Uncharacterized protein n=1 Tax=Streptomyces synnematoformans TaxID=415721 RepID=A0ABP5K3R9_9ACTN
MPPTLKTDVSGPKGRSSTAPFGSRQAACSSSGLMQPSMEAATDTAPRAARDPAPPPRYSPAEAAAAASTSRSIAGVSRPVKVFCWLTW